MGYAFISYSTKNQNEADALRSYLRKQGVQTWMAPGDIPAGSEYAQVINQAVRGCACFVLVLSNASQNSQWVSREVERAINYEKIIIPIQIENVVLNDAFSYYIGSSQVVAVQKVDESSEGVQKVVKSVLTYTQDDSQVSYDAPEISTMPAETGSAGQPAPIQDAVVAEPPKKEKKKGTPFISFLGFVLMVVLLPKLTGEVMLSDFAQDLSTAWYIIFMALPALAIGIVMLLFARRNHKQGFSDDFATAYWMLFAAVGSVVALVYIIILRDDLRGFSRFWISFLHNLLPTCISFLLWFIGLIAF